MFLERNENENTRRSKYFLKQLLRKENHWLNEMFLIDLRDGKNNVFLELTINNSELTRKYAR